MNQRNSTQTVWVDTHRVTLAEYESTAGYPLSEFPAPRRTDDDNRVRSLFWGSYLASVLLIAVCSAILAVWPN